MTNKPISELPRRTIADMTIRTFSGKTLRDYIRQVEAFAGFSAARRHCDRRRRRSGLDWPSAPTPGSKRRAQPLDHVQAFF
jgi:hypothetical protein